MMVMMKIMAELREVDDDDDDYDNDNADDNRV